MYSTRAPSASLVMEIGVQHLLSTMTIGHCSPGAVCRMTWRLRRAEYERLGFPKVWHRVSKKAVSYLSCAMMRTTVTTNEMWAKC